MNWFRRIFHRKDIAEELAEEMRLHLEERIEAFEHDGMSRAQAEQAARRAFGNTTVLAERSRETWQWPRIESLLADAKYALRQLRNAPAFAATAILTLALGIGVNTSIFTVFQQVLLRTMPVHKAEELVLLEEHSRFETGTWSTSGGEENLYFAYPAFEALQRNTVTTGMATSSGSGATLSFHDATESVRVQFVSGNYFDVLGLQPTLGRLLTPDDNRLHAGNAVAVVSEAYWQAKLGADRSLLNRTILLNGVQLTLVGIVRHQGLMDSNPGAFFLPAAIRQTVVPWRGDAMPDPLNAWTNIVARLAPGVTPAQAESQLNTIWWNWRRDTLKLRSHNIADQAGWLQTHLSVKRGARGISLLEDSFGQPVAVLQVMALVVLLIVCGNIANLLLARAVRRHSELAMRAALGASRQRIFQQVMIEGVVLGLTGAALGLPIGWLTLRLLLQTTPESDTLRLALTPHMDWRMASISIFAGLLTSVFFSLAPAFLSLRIDLIRSLHGQGGAVTSRAGGLRSALVVAQIALSLALMASATIFACNLYRLRGIHPGFATSRVLSISVDASRQGKGPALVEEEYKSIVAGLLRLPGVTGAVYARNALISGDTSGGNASVLGFVSTEQDPDVERNAVSPGFFSAMEIPLIAGREFTDTDAASNQQAAIVDQAFVNYYFHGDIHKAIGGLISFGGKPNTPIVGIIPTVRATDYAKEPERPLVFIPWSIQGTTGWQVKNFPATFYIRTTSDPEVLAASVRSLVRSVDNRLPLASVETMQQHVDDLLFSNRLVAILSAAMGALALLLASIGLYGVLAFSVAQRTREIGIRMALGADRRSVSALVCGQVVRLVAAGALFGSMLAWAALRMLISQDKDLASTPWWLFSLTGAVLLLAVATATLLPARRATLIDPMRALRTE